MTCTRTGAHIWLEPYGEWLYGDAFEIGQGWDRETDLGVGRAMLLGGYGVSNWPIKTIAYFNIVARSFKPVNGLLVKHYTVHSWEEWFNQGDIEQQLRGSFLVTNNFTNHGYYGEPIDD